MNREELFRHIKDISREIGYKRDKYDPIIGLTKLEREVWNKITNIDNSKKNEITFTKNSRKTSLAIPRFLTRQLKLLDKINVWDSGAPVIKFLTDNDVENLSAELNKLIWPTLDIKICWGKEITENYRNEVGGHSCMTGSNAGRTLLYEMNPDRFEQLIIKLANDKARAMIMHCDNGRIFLDRVYATSNKLKEYAREHAKERNWGYRYNDNPENKSIVNCNVKDLIISGLKYKNGNVPWMDTFCSYSLDDKLLNIFHPGQGTNSIGTLQHTNGRVNSASFCCNCEEELDEDEIRSFDGQLYCEDCFTDRFSYCECCEEYYHSGDVAEVQGDNRSYYYCDRCVEQNAFQCEECGDYFVNDLEYINEDSSYCEECYDRILEGA